MTSNPFARLITMLVMVSMLTPAAFFAAPPQAHATWPVANIPGIVADALQLIQQTISAVNNVITSAATYADMINTYVLQPMLYIMSGQILKDITASIVNFVTGKTNGTNMPQYVTNLALHLQHLGDTQARAYFSQYGLYSKSPFAAGIISSMAAKYVEQTSTGSFLRAHQSTLDQVSPNVNAYLSGDWSQGGVRAWFALTTQDNNNPYLLYGESQAQLQSRVSDAMTNRLAQLSWGQGFLSWCGPATPAADQLAAGSQAANDTLASGIQYQGLNGTNTVIPATDNTPDPGDPCTRNDGSSGTIMNPGTVIKNELDQAIFLPIQKIIGLGSLANEVTQISQSIGTIMQTVDLASQILNAGSGGLGGIGDPTATDPTSRLQLFSSAPGFLGVTQTQVQNTAATNATITTISNQVSQYSQGWNAIQTVAQYAASAVNNLINACPSQTVGAQYALTNIVNPAISQAAQANVVTTNANAMIQQVRNDVTTNSTALATDLQTLQTMPPSAADSTTAQQQSQGTGAAVDNPPGSLFITGGTMMDRLTLVSANAVSMTNSSTTCP
jgi:hypothetical protein